MATKTSGREQKRATAAAQQRTPDLSKFYRYKLPPAHPGDYTFHLKLLRPSLPAVSLDTMVTDFEWIDEQSVLTGSITAQIPEPENPNTLPIVRGHLVQCTVDWGSNSYRLWTMRVNAPQTQIDQGYVQFALQDDMALLDEGKRDWIFRKTKHRNFGYYCHEIAASVCRQLGVPVRTLAKGTKRVTMHKRNITGAAAIRAAYALEQTASGRSFVMRFRDGKLEVVTLQRNPQIYQFASEIQTALLTSKGGAKAVPTILTGTGHIGKGKHTKKISFTARHEAAIKQYGRIHNYRTYGQVASHAELRDKVRRQLAADLRLNDTVEIEHNGIPFILRGDAAQLYLPNYGYKGANSIVFCTSADHSVQAGIYTGTYDFGISDPYLGQLKTVAKAQAARQKAAAKRARSKLKKKKGRVTK